MQAHLKTSSEHKKPRLYIIDGYGFVFRAYHSMPPLTTKSGLPVGAIYGFTNMLIRLFDEIKKDGDKNYVIVAFDSGKKTFRHEMYPAYKANRPEPPADLIVQFPLVREVTEALNIQSVELPGYEADDIIATYTKLAREKDIDVVVVSSDKDLMQLVSDGVQMFDPVKYKAIGEKEVLEKFGVNPEKVLDVLSLIGDSSDNIPGIPGIGPKTAAELIHEFGDLDSVLANPDKIKQKKRSELIKEHKEKAILSRTLLKLNDNVPADKNFEHYLINSIDKDKLIEFLRKYDFHSLISRIEKKPAASETHVKPDTNIKSAPTAKAAEIKSIDDLKSWLTTNKIEKEIFIYFYSEESTSLYIALAYKEFITSKIISCYFSLRESSGSSQIGFDFERNAEPSAHGIAISDALVELKSLLNNNSILKVGYDIKKLQKFLMSYGCNLVAYSDISLISYLLDNVLKEHTLEAIGNDYFQERLEEKANYVDLSEFFTHRISIINMAHSLLKKRLFSEHLTFIYEKIEKPIIDVLSDMELAGIKVDKAELQKLSSEFTAQISLLEKGIFQIAGEEFNIASPKQLGHILFEKMGIEGGKKSKKSGTYGTSVDILENISAQGHTIADKILEWRHLSKLKSTYTEALLKEIDSKTNRIHTTFSITVTSTGRLSSHNPNLQNIPIRTEEGKKIRRAFISEKGNVLISADYNQIELRILAHLANIDVLKKAFIHGDDIHSITAHQVFGVPLENVDPEIRRRAKTINFGIIYGQTAYGLSKQLGIGVSDADKYIKAYFERYPGIKEYMDNAKDIARKHGYVTTVWGRRCYLPYINDRNPTLRNFAERAAINAPLQGTAADIIKKAMISVNDSLKNKMLESKLIMQVHDELLIESPENEKEQAAKILKEKMENAVKFSVPITVDIRIGSNWGEIH